MRPHAAARQRKADHDVIHEPAGHHVELAEEVRHGGDAAVDAAHKELPSLRRHLLEKGLREGAALQLPAELAVVLDLCRVRVSL